MATEEMISALPPFDPARSDGCSVPRWLRLVVPMETVEQRRECLRHDEAYYYGGTAFRRAVADHMLYTGLVVHGMSRPQAWLYWLAVRLFGGPSWKREGVSWAWGGSRFVYDEEHRSGI